MWMLLPSGGPLRAGWFPLGDASGSSPLGSSVAVASRAVNQVKSRLQALGLLDRTFANAADEDLDAAVAALDDEHRDALVKLVGDEPTAAEVRAAVARGRLDGTMESVALVLTDACLADCIEQL